MKHYIGTKRVNAKPMTRGEYNAFRGWQIPADEDPRDEGYLVEYVDGGGANTTEYKGYVSWSPKDVFDRSYRETTRDSGGLGFGAAIDLLRTGHCLTREGWNGKGMFVYLVPAASYPASRNANSTMVGCFPGDMVPYRDYIAMKTAQGDVVPWVASQSDILASDWKVFA